jgi:hypothetical protein
VSGAIDSGSSTPDGIDLKMPNPFHAETRIDHALAASGSVDLRVLDTAGRLGGSLSIPPAPGA